MSVRTFFGLPVPQNWVIMESPSDQTFMVASVHGGVRNKITATELCHMLEQEQKDERHRQATPAARGNPAAQPTAGDPGRAHQASNSLPAYPAGALSNQGTGQSQLTPQSLAQVWAQTQLTHRIEGKDRVTESPLPRACPHLGELVGHRCWMLNMSCDHLFSVTMTQVGWPPGGVVSDRSADIYNCGRGRIGDCNNRGVWAFKDPHDLAKEFGSLLQITGGCVFGTVWMWGTVIEHERGYRAQYAAVRSLDRAAKRVDLEALRARYCPPEAKTWSA